MKITYRDGKILVDKRIVNVIVYENFLDFIDNKDRSVYLIPIDMVYLVEESVEWDKFGRKGR